MIKVNVEIRGIAPMIHHNIRLADPFNNYAHELKKLTSKRKKTEDDLAEIRRLEWLGAVG